MILYRNVECFFEKHKIAARFPKIDNLKVFRNPTRKKFVKFSKFESIAYSSNSYIPN